MEQNFDTPTMGRIVNYFPHPSETVFQGRVSVPAIVQDADIYPTLTIFTGNQGLPVVVEHTVSHKDRQAEGRGYWTWPVRQ